MKPANYERKTRRLKELNERLDRLIAKGYLSLAEQREVLEEVVRKNGFEGTLQEIRRRN